VTPPTGAGGSDDGDDNDVGKEEDDDEDDVDDKDDDDDDVDVDDGNDKDDDDGNDGASLRRLHVSQLQQQLHCRFNRQPRESPTTTKSRSLSTPTCVCSRHLRNLASVADDSGRFATATK
jgi:hypothetical protein